MHFNLFHSIKCMVFWDYEMLSLLSLHDVNMHIKHVCFTQVRKHLFSVNLFQTCSSTVDFINAYSI